MSTTPQQQRARFDAKVDRVLAEMRCLLDVGGTIEDLHTLAEQAGHEVLAPTSPRRPAALMARALLMQSYEDDGYDAEHRAA